MIDLDEWLPEPQVRGSHRRSAGATPEHLWRAAAEVRVCDSPVLGRAVRWRIPGTAAKIPFRDLLRSYPFAVLDEGSRWSVSGLCGRLWTLRRDYPVLHGPDDFLTWDEPGTARVLIAHWVEPDGDGAILCNESRISPVDSAASVRLRALWALTGGLERLVGGEALGAAIRRAEEASA
ncbi:MAG: hypothetical protein ACJ75I_07395 [Solirubrobacterales bacterium]